MQAVKFGSPASLASLAVVDIADPGAPGEGEVRVAVRAVSLNYRDVAGATGAMPSDDDFLPFADAAGVVEAIGPGVTSLAIGDHVISRFFPTWDAGEPPVADFSTTPGDGFDGFGAQFVVRPAHHFCRAPTHLTFEQAATVPVAAVTAWRALVVEGGLKAGDTVLILGTGGVSIIALQIARAMGARVIATTSSEQKAEQLLSTGVDAVINYRTTPEWGQAVFALTGGRGVDHVVEIGGSGTLQQSIEAVRLGGSILMLGILTGFGGEISTFPITMKQIKIKGVVVGSLQDQLQVIRAMEINDIIPVIDRTFPIAELNEAFRYQAEGRHFGKVVIRF